MSHPKNTLALTLHTTRRLTLDEFAQAISHYNALVNAVSQESAPDSRIDWLLVALAVTCDGYTLTVKADAKGEGPEAI